MKWDDDFDGEDGDEEFDNEDGEDGESEGW